MGTSPPTVKVYPTQYSLSTQMASKTCVFLESGTNAQFDFVLTKYQEALNAKAHAKSSRPETLLKLDKWYQTELPKKIKARGTDAFLTHDEIVQTIKWKLARGQFRPRLKDLVQMNTPRVVMQETKKAFRAIYKKKDLEAAVLALSNLKGVGPAMASAVLAAGAPEVAPFMADECLLSMPDIEGIDYTTKEYLKLVEKTKECVDRLNSQGGEWTPHKVELALWTHYVARDIKPELLADMPGTNQSASPHKTAVNGDSEATSAAGDTVNGAAENDTNTPATTDGDKPEAVAADGDHVNGITKTVEESAASVADNKPTTEMNGTVEEADTTKATHSDKTEKVDSSETATAAVAPVNGSDTMTEAAENSVTPAEKMDDTPAASDSKPAEDKMTTNETKADEVVKQGKEESSSGKDQPTDTTVPPTQNGTESQTQNGDAKTELTPDHANGVKENGSSNEETKEKENGTADKSEETLSLSSTKEESVVSGGEATKRSLDTDEAGEESPEHKRLKEDNTASSDTPVAAAVPPSEA